MEIVFLKTDSEALAFFLSIPYYLWVMFHIQAKYLMLLKQKNSKKEVKKANLRAIYLKAVTLLLIGFLIHLILYVLFYAAIRIDNGQYPSWRNQYVLWIGATFVGFCLGVMFNFFLKGTSTLPTQDGPVTGV